MRSPGAGAPAPGANGSSRSTPTKAAASANDRPARGQRGHGTTSLGLALDHQGGAGQPHHRLLGAERRGADARGGDPQAEPAALPGPGPGQHVGGQTLEVATGRREPRREPGGRVVVPGPGDSSAHRTGSLGTSKYSWYERLLARNSAASSPVSTKRYRLPPPPPSPGCASRKARMRRSASAVNSRPRTS